MEMQFTIYDRPDNNDPFVLTSLPSSCMDEKDMHNTSTTTSTTTTTISTSTISQQPKKDRQIGYTTINIAPYLCFKPGHTHSGYPKHDRWLHLNTKLSKVSRIIA